MVPRIPLDAKRWIFEMDEIARTYAANGMTPDFHTGAGTIMRLAAQTPLSAETRETARDDHDLADVLASYVTALKQQKNNPTQIHTIKRSKQAKYADPPSLWQH